MLSSCSFSRSLPLSVSNSCFSPIRVSNHHHPASLPFSPTFPPSQSLQNSSNQIWRILCSKHDEFPYVDPNPGREDFRSKWDKPSGRTRDWVSSLQEVANAVFEAIEKPWTVPWTARTILQVTLLWIASFWFVGSWMIPFGAHMVGITKESLSYRGQALYSLLTDATEGLVGFAILHRCLSSFRPLPHDWFKFSLSGNWPLDVAIGCLMFPLVNHLSQLNLNLLPLLPSTPVTLSSVEQSILARDPIAMALYGLVVSVCAPVWEEIIFRGFLLPSLAKYMPVWCSILVSSVAFALVHFNAQSMLPLIFLGVVLGAIYARSRNLLPSMVLHSLWNGFVFLGLMK